MSQPLWHHTPQAQAILSRIDPAKLTTFDRRDANRPDGRFYAADEHTRQKLEDIRRACADKAVGYTFMSTQEPFDRDACAAWLDALGPEVTDVLTDLASGRLAQVEQARAAA